MILPEFAIPEFRTLRSHFFEIEAAEFFKLFPEASLLDKSEKFGMQHSKSESFRVNMP